MLYTRPDYYKEFTCIAEQCEDTCCAGWQIVIDSASMKKYRGEKSAYKKKLHHSIHWLQKTFKQDKEKRCAFLTEENLCDMYLNLGEKSLCRTCRQYPRHMEEFENVREASLSLSCPEVAKLLLSRKEKVKFQYRETEEEEEWDDFSPFLYSQLVDARELMIELLRNRKLSIENRIVLCLGLAYDMQNRIDADELFGCGDVIENYRKQAYFSSAGRKVDRYRKNIKAQYQFAHRVIEDLYQLELLKEEWDMLLQEAQVRLFGKGEDVYAEIMDEFSAWIQTEYQWDWNIQCEQLMVYFIYTYFCGAVYDERILVNAEMAVAAVSVIWNLMAATWLKNEKQLDLEDVCSIAYRYSRELEHSDENLKRYWNILDEEKLLFR